MPRPRMQVIRKEQRRGSTLKLTFTIRSITATNEKSIDPINIDNLALIRLKFRVNSLIKWCLEPYIAFKKHDKAQDSTVNITVSYGEFEKECPCADYWIEYIKLEPAVEYDKNFKEMSTNILLYVVEVSVTVHDRTSVPLYSKLYQDTKLTDFYLRATDGTVAVHKVILGVYSDKFLSMLNGKWKESTDGHISLDGVTIHTLQYLKKYMYLRTLPHEQLQLQHLLLVAVCYSMDNLRAECIAKLVKLVTLNNFDTLIEFACQNNLPELVKAIATEVPDSIVNGINQMKINKQICKTE